MNGLLIFSAFKRLWKSWQIRGVLGKNQELPEKELWQYHDISVGQAYKFAMDGLALAPPKSVRRPQVKFMIRHNYHLLI